MAPTEQDKTAKPEKADAPAAVAASSADKFPVERFRSDECFALTGIERFIVAGALSGTNKTEMTKDEVQTAVDKWLASPVQED